MFKYLCLIHVENVHLYPRAYGIEEVVAEEEGVVNQINSTSIQAYGIEEVVAEERVVNQINSTSIQHQT